MPPVEVIIEVIQYTPDNEPVVIHYSGKGKTNGPLSRTAQHHTTQTALAARIIPANRGVLQDRWGCDEAKAELVVHLAENGITAVVVENTPVAPPPAQ